jgi:hypothetical protein
MSRCNGYFRVRFEASTSQDDEVDDVVVHVHGWLLDVLPTTANTKTNCEGHLNGEQTVLPISRVPAHIGPENVRVSSKTDHGLLRQLQVPIPIANGQILAVRAGAWLDGLVAHSCAGGLARSRAEHGGAATHHLNSRRVQ